MIKVLIPEPIPPLNRGEAAILEGLCVALSTCGPTKISLFCPKPWLRDASEAYAALCQFVTGIDHQAIDYRHDGSQIELSRTTKWIRRVRLLGFSILARLSRRLACALTSDQLLRSIADTDIILCGHDGMLGVGQFWMCCAGRILGIPVVLFGGGKGAAASASAWDRFRLRFIAKHAAMCAVRESGTLAHFLAAGVPPTQVQLIPDPAVLMPLASVAELRELAVAEGIPDPLSTPLIGLMPAWGGVVPRYSFQMEHSQEKRLACRIELWKNLIHYLLDNTNAHLVLIPHCLGPADNDDRHMIDAIVRELRTGKGGHPGIDGTAASRISAISQTYSARVFKGLSQMCQMVVGERTHGLIGAFSSGTPCIALTVEQDLRMHRIIGEMFKQAVFNLNQPDQRQMLALVADLWRNRELARSNMSDHVNFILRRSREASEELKQAVQSASGSLSTQEPIIQRKS